MTLKELMLGNIQSNQSAAVMQLGTQTNQKAGNRNDNNAFGEILGSKMSSTEKQSSVKRSDVSPASSRKAAEPLTAREDSKPEFLTYREANDYNSKQASSESSSAKTVKEVDSRDSKPVEAEDESKKEAVRDNTLNSMIQAIAQMMGLDAKELQKLLDQACIKSESLNNLDNISENVSKLSQMLGLDDQQQETLLKLFEMTGDIINAGGSGTNNTAIRGGAAGNSEPFDKAAGALAQNSDKMAQSPEANQPAAEIEALLAKLNAKIKTRLNELGNELEKNQGSVEASLKQILQPLTDKAAGKIQDSLQPEDGAAEAEISADPGLTAAADTASAKNGGEEQHTQAKTEKEADVQQPAAAVKETQPQTGFTVVQPDKPVIADEAGKAAITRTPADAKEIINQVIEKAKVILTPDKSEMIMDLKPDSLGKISLKVATENGMIMAKFVAENQQVKQVLESNMQLLKDSLEKQGMNVQGFSVSVRQDSNRPAENWKQSDGSANRNVSGTEYRIPGINGSLTGAIETAERNNPYTWGGSTINLTA